MTKSSPVFSKFLLVFAISFCASAIVASIGLFAWTKSLSTSKPSPGQHSQRTFTQQNSVRTESPPSSESKSEIVVSSADADTIAFIMNEFRTKGESSENALSDAVERAKDLEVDGRIQFLKELLSVRPELVSTNAEELMFFVAGWDEDASVRVAIARKLLIPTIYSSHVSSENFEASNAAIFLLKIAAIPREIAPALQLDSTHPQASKIVECFAEPIQSIIDQEEYDKIKAEFGETLAKGCMAIVNGDLKGRWIKQLDESSRLKVVQLLVQQFVKAASPEMAKNRTVDALDIALGGAGLNDYSLAIKNAAEDLSRPLPSEVLDDWVTALESPTKYHHGFVLDSQLCELVSQSVPELQLRALKSIVHRANATSDLLFLAIFSRLCQGRSLSFDSEVAKQIATPAFERLANTSWSDVYENRSWSGGFEEVLDFSTMIAINLAPDGQKDFARTLLRRCESSRNTSEIMAIVRSILTLKPEFDLDEFSRLQACLKKSFQLSRAPDYVLPVQWETLLRIHEWHPIALDQEWVEFFIRDIKIAGPRLEGGMEQSLKELVASQDQREAVSRLNGGSEKINLILQSALQTDSKPAEDRLDQNRDKGEPGIGSFNLDTIHRLSQEQFEEARKLLTLLSKEKLIDCVAESMKLLSDSKSPGRLRQAIMLCDMANLGVVNVDDVLSTMRESSPEFESHEFAQIFRIAVPLQSLDRIEQKLRESWNVDQLSTFDESYLSESMDRWMREASQERSDSFMTDLLEYTRRIPNRPRGIRTLLMTKFHGRSSQCLAFCKKLWQQEPNDESNLQKFLSFLEMDDQKKFRDFVQEQVDLLVKSTNLIYRKQLKDYLTTLPKLLEAEGLLRILEAEPEPLSVADYVLAIASNRDDLSIQQKNALFKLWADRVQLSEGPQLVKLVQAIEPLRSELGKWRPNDLIPRLIKSLPSSQNALSVIADGELTQQEIYTIIVALIECKNDNLSDVLIQYCKLANPETTGKLIEVFEKHWKSSKEVFPLFIEAYVVLLETAYPEDQEFIRSAFRGLEVLCSNYSFSPEKEHWKKAVRTRILRAVSERLAIPDNRKPSLYLCIDYCKRYGIPVR